MLADSDFIRQAAKAAPRKHFRLSVYHPPLDTRFALLWASKTFTSSGLVAAA